jgi:hypothetical protein
MSLSGSLEHIEGYSDIKEIVGKTLYLDVIEGSGRFLEMY